MKKYSLEWVLDPKHTRFTRATKPKPFPGRYPTRITYSGVLLNGKRIGYIGKPTRRITTKFNELLEQYMLRSVLAIEFDRNGCIARLNSPSPLAACDAATLRTHYHPFVTGRREKFFAKPGRWNAVQRRDKREYVFWPDSIPYVADMCQGYEFTIPEDVAPVRQRTPEPMLTNGIPPINGPFDLDAYQFTVQDLGGHYRQQWNPLMMNRTLNRRTEE